MPRSASRAVCQAFLNMTALQRWPFLVAGLVTLGLFLVVEAGVPLPIPLLAILKFLIIPMWLVWTGVAAAHVLVAGPDRTALSGAFWLAGLVLGLAPYTLVDVLIARRRRSKQSRTSSFCLDE
jgi:hypothetical protein